ncbi:recombinase family protein [Thalassotalea litorea]|uniref:recombinase family protein n=1 Tax=Thalassotalea litorea TaxID=2020715 RepID=UPI0037364375
MTQVAYIRVSTVEQNTERQLAALDLDSMKVFTDKCSGKDRDRPELNKMLDYVREGDTIHVHDISRLARSVNDLLTMVKDLTSQGVTLKFYNESLTFTPNRSDPMQELQLTMLGAVFQFERSMMLERQREGIAQAKAAGKYKGRRKSKDINREAVLESLKSGLSIRKTAAEHGIAASTVQRIVAESA